ncbi:MULTISPECIES: hypothetical protein [Gammaproteobacteria]|uniref:hypothetical protein n=1 Tax=Gammaproteobacteria TaxID=1236 RepID=UPI000DD067B2|nr:MULTISPECIES: hypothetical protein [Gammaproteobacteria]RTE86450.1 hypothetical protein DQX04_07795 [Aliidiomarina sp. B3213]TCZ90995.1 hypothetical protein EYQ95_09250 [Lysobacter sp. N42]
MAEIDYTQVETDIGMKIMLKLSMYCALVIFLVLSSNLSYAQQRCSGSEYQQFDFWVGEWNVYNTAGDKVGINAITKTFDGCALHEQYQNMRDYRGASYNIYDATREVWHQTWVDNGGLLLVLEGGVIDGKMVLSGETQNTDGKVLKQRISWELLNDGRVRQLWETRQQDEDWTVAFDGYYERQP